jgi:Cu-Zn family superoxide dismutase
MLDADGAAVVIHQNADDHATQPIGGAGPRLACAVVQRAN